MKAQHAAELDSSAAGVTTPMAARLNHLVCSLPHDELAAAAACMADVAFSRGLWFERDGHRERAPLALRPRVLSPRDVRHARWAAWQLRSALERLGRLVIEDPDARGALPLEPRELEWMARCASPEAEARERVFCRLDGMARLEGPGWASTLRFIEPNVIAPAGVRFGPAAEEATTTCLLPALAERDRFLRLLRPSDPRLLLLSELLAHAGTPKPAIALVEDTSIYALGAELGFLAEHYRSLGVDAVLADPRDLRCTRDGSVVVDGRQVDVVYRFVDLAELGAMEDAGSDLSAWRVAFRRGRVVPGLGGDLEHKSTFELLTDARFRHAFTAEQQRALTHHVVWTRLLYERRTAGPDGRDIELIPFVQALRERLVIKPNRSYGGRGVVIGPAVDGAAWDEAIEGAMRAPRTHVVQLAVPADLEHFPVMDDAGRARLEPRHGSVGLFPSPAGVGFFGRIGRDPVVNLQTGGAVVPFLVSAS